MIKRIAVVSVGLLAVVAWSGTAYAQANVEKGMKVYADSKCSLCHSIAGKGNAKGPLDDAAKFSAADMKAWITEPAKMAAKANATRKPAMKAYPNMPAADLDALVAYLQTLKKQ